MAFEWSWSLWFPVSWNIEKICLAGNMDDLHRLSKKIKLAWYYYIWAFRNIIKFCFFGEKIEKKCIGKAISWRNKIYRALDSRKICNINIPIITYFPDHIRCIIFDSEAETSSSWRMYLKNLYLVTRKKLSDKSQTNNAKNSAPQDTIVRKFTSTKEQKITDIKKYERFQTMLRSWVYFFVVLLAGRPPRQLPTLAHLANA